MKENKIFTQKYVMQLNAKCDDIQSKYEFNIPKYILTELVENGSDKLNICSLINLAVMNDRISVNEGNLLKKDYKLNNKIL